MVGCTCSMRWRYIPFILGLGPTLLLLVVLEKLQQSMHKHNHWINWINQPYLPTPLPLPFVLGSFRFYLTTLATVCKTLLCSDLYSLWLTTNFNEVDLTHRNQSLSILNLKIISVVLFTNESQDVYWKSTKCILIWNLHIYHMP